MGPLHPLIGLASFALFLVLGLRLKRTSPGPGRRQAVAHLVLYLIAVHLLAGVTQRDNWPFTSHTIAIGRARADRPICVTEFRGVDGSGREWRLDPYAFSPVFDSILQFWCDVNLARLSGAERDRVLGFLLAKAEAARLARLRGDPVGPQRVLGPLAAPYWWLLPRVEAMGSQPYVGLRVYRACWVPEERLAAPDRVERRLTAGLGPEPQP